MPLPIGTAFPSLEGATDWLNAPLDPLSLRDQPVLVQFWAISCPICKINMPKLLEFLETYRQDGLTLVSVHMPRMEQDMDVEKVRAAAEELHLVGPCAVDNTHTIGDRFETGGVWPCYYLFDSSGRLRSRAAGQMGLLMAENSLKRMLERSLEAVMNL